MIILFADDAKLFARVDGTDGATQLQDDLNTLSDWAGTWQLTFNAKKCKSMNIGYNNPMTKYNLTTPSGTSPLESTRVEKDLGVLVDDQLSFTAHVETAVNKANRILGLIRVAYSYLDQTSLRLLYTALVRPHLECANAAWSPRYSKDRQLIESVQHRATRLVPELRQLPYKERLRRLGLPSLFYRRARGDMIEVYKILHKVYKLPYTLLEKAPDVPTRGHSLKLAKNKCRLEVRRNFFSQRVVNNWNSLPEDIVEAPCLNTFKARLDRYWRNYLYEEKPIVPSLKRSL